MKIFKNFKEGLTKNVIVLGIVSGLTDISSEMLYPVIPIFLSQVLNAPMTVIGLIEGIAESTANILKIWGGYLSDKIKKRKILVIIGYSLSAIAKPIMAFAFSWYFVLFARFIDRIGKGIRTSPRDALISASSRKENWGKAFGFHRAMDTFGAAVGPLVTLLFLYLLGETSSSYRAIFIIAFTPAIAGVFILKRYVVEEADINQENPKTASNINTKEPLSLDFKLFVAIYILFSLAKFSDVFLIMKVKSVTNSTATTILVYFLYNIFYALLSTPAGIISDRIGKVKVFMLSFIIYSIVCLGFAKSITFSSLLTFFLIYSIYGALNEGIAKAIVSSMSTPNNRATAMGIFQGLGGIATFLASLIAGILWDKFSAPTPFIVSATISFLSFIFFQLWISIRKIKI